MSQIVKREITELKSMKKYPSELFYKGNLSLLDRPKISIVGTRRPSAYTRQFTYTLSKALAKRGICIVSGAAMGVDSIAHDGAGAENTIAVTANGLDIRYPAVNKNLIESIENSGLVISQFNDGIRATNWSFVIRNELVVALGELLVVTQADLDSGSMRSVEYALKMGKEVWVFAHRIGESLGTTKVLLEGNAKIILDIETFASQFGKDVQSNIPKDDFFYFCQQSPTFDDTVKIYGDRVYEAELEGNITIHNGIVMLQ